MIEFRFGLEVCAANPPEVLRGARQEVIGYVQFGKMWALAVDLQVLHILKDLRAGFNQVGYPQGSKPPPDRK